MADLVVGKYEFYPYSTEFRDPPPTLEELIEMLKNARAEQSEPEAAATGPREP